MFKLPFYFEDALAMVAVFGAMGLFGTFVGVGLIKNGDPPPTRTMTMEEFLPTHNK